jgi:hypothetical protein
MYILHKKYLNIENNLYSNSFPFFHIHVILLFFYIFNYRFLRIFSKYTCCKTLLEKLDNK